MDLKTTYSEQELVELLRERQEAAFKYLYDNYSAALFGVIQPIVIDTETASDVLQEVFVNIWKKIEMYDAGKGRLFTWMLNIARNASIDKLRSRNFKDARKNQPLADDVDRIAGSSTPNVDEVGLKKIVTKLKLEHRQLIDLSYFQGYTHEEIAKLLSIPLGTVKTRIRAALNQLRILMQEK